MKDLLPTEVELRDQASATILATYKRYGFRRIETPALESLKLLLGSGGGENEKLIYKVVNRGAKLDAVTIQREEDLADLGLCFDLTVPLARYYAHNRATLPDPFKAIQIGPVWRAERPQKGRFRQFTQCDIDILGVASEIAEIELILATSAALVALFLERPRIRVNDRRILSAMATHCGGDRRRRAIRSDGRPAPRRRRPGLRFLDRIRAGGVDPRRAERSRRIVARAHRVSVRSRRSADRCGGRRRPTTERGSRRVADAQ